MKLPNELVSQFAKLSKNQNEPSEKTVYGTTVMQGNKLYVNIDGSDTITPVVTMSDIKPGERVTVLIKDHSATILGNITNPSAGTEEMGKVLDEYDTIIAKIGNFELIVADKVTTEQLDAKLAIIDEALIGKATIAELEAVKATIKDLDVTNLQAEIARIDEAIIKKASIEDLDAAYAEIGILKGDVADIETLIGGNLTMDNIQSLILTSSKVTVDNAFIKDAMIDRVSASKLTAGVINTDLISIESEDGSLNINSSLQQFKDSEGNVRIQIGKDANGDFTFVLYGPDGQGQLINQNGITSSAIEDGLIVNDMVAEDAAINGSKLDIDSVIEEVNGSTTTIKSSRIFFDEENQSLDVALNNLISVTEETKSMTTSNNTSINAMQGSISTLISNTTIETENGETVLLKDEFTSFRQTVDGFEGRISAMETQGDNVTSQIASFSATINGFETRVSNTEKTVDDLEETIINTNTTITQTVNSISATVEQNGKDISSLRLTLDGIDMNGYVTFSNLSQDNGTTIINGANIRSGYISGDRIQGGTISAAEEINFIGGARIFGNEGELDAGLYVSAATYSFMGASVGIMGGSWTIMGGLDVDEDIAVAGDVDIDGSITVGSTLTVDSTMKLGYEYLYTPAGSASRDYLKLGSGIMTQDSNGFYFINSSGSWLPVRGSRFQASGDMVCWDLWASNKVYANNVALSSDQRLKTDIRYVDIDIQNEGESGLMSPNVKITTKDMHTFIETLPLASYRMINEVEKDIDYTYYGFIAQDVLHTKVGSELIEYGQVIVDEETEDEEGRPVVTQRTEERLRYSENKFIAFLAGALKEEIAQRKELEREIMSLKEIVKKESE